MRTSILGGAAAALALATAAFAQPAEAPQLRVATTQHEGVFNGQAVHYTATVSDVVVNDAAGKPAALATTIAYVRDGAADRASRPVIFAFNGGPGASSSPLHMNAIGPMIRAPAPKGDRNGGGYMANPTSPLDAADLVFIDPVGTGFSRPLPGADPRGFYTVSGDAAEVKSIIEGWLKTNGRTGSPRYLMGESYGTTRAATIAGSFPDLKFDGVMLIALASETPGREMPFVASLPTMAAGAWHWGKIDRHGRTLEQVFAQAVSFARTDYVTALIEGSSLPAAEKHRIAQKMSGFIGLPADFIEAHDLRISKNDWMFNILKDKGLRTGLLDVTVTAPMTPDAEGAIDDPALGVVPKPAAGAKAGPPPSPAQIGPVPSPAVGNYLTEQLKFPATGPYYGVNFSVNAQWNYERRVNPYEKLAAAMRANPKLRLFWAAGYFDLTTPAYSGRYTLDQAGVPAGQLTAIYFAGPHGVYDADAPGAREKFDAAVRAFVTER